MSAAEFKDEQGITRLKGTLVGGGGGGGATLLRAPPIVLDTAAISILHSSPFVLVPGVPGKWIIPVTLVGQQGSGVGIYDGLGGLLLQIDPTFFQVSATSLQNAFDAGADTLSRDGFGGGSGNIAAVSDIDGADLVIQAGNDPTPINNPTYSVTLTLWYLLAALSP